MSRLQLTAVSRWILTRAIWRPTFLGRAEDTALPFHLNAVSLMYSFQGFGALPVGRLLREMRVFEGFEWSKAFLREYHESEQAPVALAGNGCFIQARLLEVLTDAVPLFRHLGNQVASLQLFYVFSEALARLWPEGWSVFTAKRDLDARLRKILLLRTEPNLDDLLGRRCAEELPPPDETVAILDIPLEGRPKSGIEYPIKPQEERLNIGGLKANQEFFESWMDCLLRKMEQETL